MEGLKEALEYTVNLSTPHYKEVDGVLFSDKTMYEMRKEIPKATPLEMRTLTGLLDYIKSESDVMAPYMFIHVKSPTEVELYAQLDENRGREKLVSVSAMIPEFRFGYWYPSEEFIIHVMSKFIDGNAELINDKDKILKFAGTSQAGTVADYGDDGISQKVSVQKTVTSREEDIVPNPVHLTPFRTFLEVEQPSSDFIFRMRGDGGICAALYEADGGAWKLDAIKNIKDYLEKQLKDISTKTIFTIIA